MKIVTVVGARPQFIKAAAVSRELQKHPEVSEVLVHTGQHYDAGMSDIFFSELNIPTPMYNLGIGSGSHGEQTGKMLGEIEEVLLNEKPDWLMVYGDTNSTLAGALAAAKLHIPVAHVEAGLRSFNKKMPEEINRILTDNLSSVLFTPTDVASHNLKREGFPQELIREVGDVMYDATLYYGRNVDAVTRLENMKLPTSNYVLATIHRAENTDDLNRLTAIFEAFVSLAKEREVVLPIHPRTRKFIKEKGIRTGNIQLIDPVGYLDMIALEQKAELIATDSGGVQKEAYFHRVPCVTLRDETEWTELIDTGWNTLQAPIGSDEILNTIIAKIGSKGVNVELYGGGQASTRIAEFFLNPKAE